MARHAKGFTLVELMIVVVIVGILTAVSIPLYQVYIVKSQLNRVVAELGQYRTPVEDAVGSSSSITNALLGYTPSNLTTGQREIDIATFAPDGSGQLSVTLGGNVHPSVTGVKVGYHRSAGGEWECIIDNSANLSGWSDMFMPKGCRL